MKKLSAAAIAAVFSAGAALAQGTGSEGYFQIYNDTAEHTVTGFYTNDGSGWSTDWLGGMNLRPGENAMGEFHADSGPCEQILQVGWLGEDGGEVLDDPIEIDICEASNVYLDDNEIFFD